MVEDRPFERYRRRVTWLLAPLIVSLPIAPFVGDLLLGSWLGPLAPLVALLAYLWWLRDRGVLVGNRRLRREVAAKLERFGYRVETGHDYFVGVAYPCFYGSTRRLVETDDDVGFLSITPQGLSFIGDGLEFSVPAEQVGEVALEPLPAAPLVSQRVRVQILDGEPQDAVVFDLRHRASHIACNRANRQLAAALRTMAAGATRQGRLISPQREPSLVDAR